MLTRGKELGDGRVKESGMDMYISLYSKWIATKILPYSTGNSAQYVAAWMGGGLEGWGMNTRICMTVPSLFP